MTKNIKIQDEKTSSPLKNTKKDKGQKIQRYRFTDRMSKWSIQYWKEKYKESFKKRDMFLVIMQLRNGKYDMFTIATAEKSFDYKGGHYYIDTDMVREDVHTSLNSLYYHQDITMPVRIDFEVDKLLNQIQHQAKDVVKAVNPFSLKGFIHSQVIEKVLKGQELSDEMRMIKMITVMNLIIALASLGILSKFMGWW